MRRSAALVCAPGTTCGCAGPRPPRPEAAASDPYREADADIRRATVMW